MLYAELFHSQNQISHACRVRYTKIHIHVTTKAYNLICGHFMNYVAKLKPLPKPQAWFPASSVLVFLQHRVNNQFFHWILSCRRKGPTWYWSAVQTWHSWFVGATCDSNEGNGYVWASSHVYEITHWNTHSWVEFWCVEHSKKHTPIRLKVQMRRATPCYLKSYSLPRGEICTTSSL